MKQDSLDQKAKRAKARWLRRVMRSDATSTAKCFAYQIVDSLNCVTLDSWLAQETLARRLSVRSVKTVVRAARELQSLGFIQIRPPARKAGCRYAVIFAAEDEYKNVHPSRHSCPQTEDTNGRESSSGILSKESLAQTRSAERERESYQSRKNYNKAERGALEMQVAKLLGPNGLNILGRLSHLDDRIVDRLCQSHFDGSLSKRDLEAARLAANQVTSLSPGAAAVPNA
jgi:hypothetical protein